jgi:deoxyribodipyrimidine photo-lyase
MSRNQTPVIYWFRQDLRLADLPGLHQAAASGRPVLPCYILDEKSPGEWSPGAASCWWLHHSLLSLDNALRSRGSQLVVRRGRTAEQLKSLIEETGATAVYCSEHFEPWNRSLEQALAANLKQDGVQLHRQPGVLLRHPEHVRNLSGAGFKVFTPFWKNYLQADPPSAIIPEPNPANFLQQTPAGLPPGDWNLLPQPGHWADHWQRIWSPGEAGASATLKSFVGTGLAGYEKARDIPSISGTSGLSPHLHFGEISPRQVWHTITAAPHSAQLKPKEKFLSELGWREFNYHLLYHYPQIPERAFKQSFTSFPWLSRPELFDRWKSGETGYPLVDAGMRELWHTGYMHNRVRMICASFLTKHLLIPWQWGARWFWDTLVDADLANNSGGWQWVAGCGADAAPYFRIFNPVLQGQKFDPQGDYVRRWVPELSVLPNKYLHAPWTLPANIAAELGFESGTTYPAPLVDHKTAREGALAAYGDMKAAAGI